MYKVTYIGGSKFSCKQLHNIHYKTTILLYLYSTIYEDSQSFRILLNSKRLDEMGFTDQGL